MTMLSTNGTWQHAVQRTRVSFSNLIENPGSSIKRVKKKRKTEGLSVVTVKKALGVNGTGIEGLLADKNFSTISLKGVDDKGRHAGVPEERH